MENRDNSGSGGQWEYIACATGDMEAGIIEELLKVNDIPVLKKFREAGGFLQICMGMTNFGIDLYVPARCFEMARILLDEREIVNTGPE